MYLDVSELFAYQTNLSKGTALKAMWSNFGRLHHTNLDASCNTLNIAFVTFRCQPI